MSIESNPGAGSFPPRSARAHTRKLGEPARSSMSRQRGRREVAPRSPIGGLVNGLGWFSIALGAAELLAPRAVNKLSGLDRSHTGLTRLFGLRELGSGIGILASEDPAPWVKARVAGDAMDLAALGLGLVSSRNSRGLTLFSIAAVAGVTALDVLASQELDRQRGKAKGVRKPIPVEATLVVNRSVEECYRFWRNLENLPRFIPNLESVTATGEQKSHWVAKAPAGTRVEWDSQITEDRPNALIAWRSLPGSDVLSTGNVRFEAGLPGRGTIVKLNMHYDAPAGRAGAGVARLLGDDPATQVLLGLRRFKQLLETGEIPTTRGQPAGRRSALARMFRKGETP
jgi:uncharacterized membrane protein